MAFWAMALGLSFGVSSRVVSAHSMSCVILVMVESVSSVFKSILVRFYDRLLRPVRGISILVILLELISREGRVCLAIDRHPCRLRSGLGRLVAFLWRLHSQPSLHP
jgi:hypothetical protein